MGYRRYTMTTALVLVGVLMGSLCGCSVLIDEAPPATWEPLPTLGPKPTDTPRPVTATPEPPTRTSTAVPTTEPTPRLTETRSPEQVAAERADEAAWARDRVWAFLVKTAPELDLSLDPQWDTHPEESLLGATQYLYRVDPWELVVAVPVLPPDAIVYQVSVRAPEALTWEGRVSPDGSIETLSMATPTPAPVLVEGWRVTMHSLPEGGSFDDFCRVVGNSNGQHGIQAPDAALESRLVDLRDSGRVAQVWGTLVTTDDDYGGSRLVVQRLAIEAPTATPVPESVLVEGWIGTIHAAKAGAAYDDYIAVRSPEGSHGLSSPMPAIEAELAALRDSGTVVQVWGVLDYGANDYGGTRLVVTRLVVP